jgi:hypothetical protein
LVAEKEMRTKKKKKTRFQMPARYPFHVLLWILSFQLPLHVLCWCMMESWGRKEKGDWLKCGPDLQNRCAYLHKEHNEKMYDRRIYYKYLPSLPSHLRHLSVTNSVRNRNASEELGLCTKLNSYTLKLRFQTTI